MESTLNLISKKNGNTLKARKNKNKCCSLEKGIPVMDILKYEE